MKNCLSFLLLLLMLASACKKTAEPNHQPTNYRIDNITTIRLDANKAYHALLQYDVVATGAVKETVTLSFEGLPGGIVMDTSNIYLTRTGVPGFTAYIHLKATDTANRQGNYKVRLVCTGSVTGKKYYDVDLIVSAKKKKLLGAVDPCNLVASVYDTDSNAIDFLGSEVDFYGFASHTSWIFTAKWDYCWDDENSLDLSDIAPDYNIVIREGNASITIEKDKWVLSGSIFYYEQFVGYKKEYFTITIPR